MTALRVNQRVRVSGPACDVVYGRVEEVWPVDALPTGPDATINCISIDELQAVGADRVAIINYHTSRDMHFLLLAVAIAGDWFDLKRHRLAIEVVGMAS
jgi:hypothetical protein